MKTPEGMNAPPFWAMYVGVPKLEEAVGQIERLGGSQMSPVIDVPTIGRMQMVRDPQGAAFYVYEPSNEPKQPEGAPEVGEGSWLELMTTDAPAALKFYSDIFGWQPSEAMDMGPMGKYYMFNRPHGMIGGMMNKPPETGERAAELADLLPRARRRCRGAAHHRERWADRQRTDGRAGR